MNDKLSSITLVAVMLCGAIAAPTPIQAHFVWLGQTSDDSGGRTAHVWFSEFAAPGEAELIEKIAGAQLWAVDQDGVRKQLKPKSSVKNETGSLDCRLAHPAASLAAQIDYGVIDRGDGPFLLKYFARYIDNPFQRTTADAQRLPVDIAASLTEDKLQLTVFVDGKPRPNVEVFIDGPKGKPTKATTDEFGRLHTTAADNGVYGIRAKVVEQRGGEFNGKKYAEVRQYATLTFPIARKVDAVQLLQQARQARATWHKFPGFSADIAVFQDGVSQHGKIAISANGKVELSGLNSKRRELERTLRSMVMHRMADHADSEDASDIAEDQPHPLGRLIKLDEDTAMGSTYRVQDDVIRQVNRKMDDGRFTISVFDVTWNEDGKYLPATYSVNFWNGDGSLKSSTTVQNEWTRVQGFDLPRRHFAVNAGKDALDYVQVRFMNHELLDQ